MQDEHQYFEKEAGRPAGQNQADSCLYRRSTAGRKRGQAIVLSDSLEVSKEKAQAVYKRGQWPRFFFTKGGKGGIARKTYLSNVGGKLPTNLWLYADVGHTDEAKKEIMAVFESKAPFSTPKPTRLIERILQIASNDDSLILDFFAGSGTTGNAVLKYNAEHEGSARRFILCTNNENGICRDVTYERIRRVIDKEDYAASLKYYKVDYVPISDRMYYEYADELLRHIRELVELENGINFTGNEEIAIVLTEDELAAFIANKDRFAKCRRLYMLCTGGFGAQANARGRTCYCISLYDGRKTSFYRTDFLGVMDEKKLPEWAQKGLEKAKEMHAQEKPTILTAPAELMAIRSWRKP